VIVNGTVIAKAGDTAYGKVQEAHHGNEWLPLFGGNGSLLRVSVEEVYNFCGDAIHVDFDRSEYRTSELGLFSSNKDIVIAKGQQYLAETDRPQRVTRHHWWTRFQPTKIMAPAGPRAGV
jgi:hypothetical protein